MKWWTQSAALQRARTVAATVAATFGAAAAVSAAAEAADGVRLSLGLFALVSALTVLLLTWREQRLSTSWVRDYLRYARNEPAEVVGTAGHDVREVIGRDDLCQLIIEDIADRRRRRPHVVIADLGVGKTAVLVRLAQLLAERGLVPVAIDLSALEPPLNFMAEARRRFIGFTLERSHLTEREADAAWDELRNFDRIVVLGDNLEWAQNNEQGDSTIATAFGVSQRRGLPLVVASRPHGALVGLSATFLELPPLDEHSALAFIQGAAPKHDAHRLEWLVETAEVTEAPLFLRIAHELHELGLFSSTRTLVGVDTRGSDRLALRLGMLEAWTEAIIAGHFQPELPMTSELRHATIEQLSALACVGLAKDSPRVGFAQLLVRWPLGHPRAGSYRYEGLIDYLCDLIRSAHGTPIGTWEAPVHFEREIRLAASRGARLGLAEVEGDGVRFPQSILQAYLASRVINRVMTDDPTPAIEPSEMDDADRGYLARALPQPSRELLIALTMYSRRSHAALIPEVREKLCSAEVIARLDTPKKLDVLVSALEIDCMQHDSRHRKIAQQLVEAWPRASEDRTVEDAKLKAVARLGEAARMLQRRAVERGSEVDLAYPELFTIAKKDIGYRVRLAASQELARGGDAAFEVLATMVTYDGEVGVLRPPQPDELVDDDIYRESALRAWLAPMFVQSTNPTMVRSTAGPSNGERHERSTHLEARKNLDMWLAKVRLAARTDDDDMFPLILEVALAQGFRHAANRRPRAGGSETRAHLAERATAMVEVGRFWHSRLALVQALCLWALSGVDQQHAAVWAAKRPHGTKPREHDRRGREPQRGAGDPQALVSRWLSTTRGRREHPYVAEVGQLAILALTTRQPEKYLWTDESSIVTTIGGRPPTSTVPTPHVWIRQSIGWNALDPRAQKLVADALLMLNLIERESDPVRRNERMLRANRDDLPPCLTGERDFLEPTQTVGSAVQPTPGAACKDGCPFDLCPYPPKGVQPFRLELNEAFCRCQQDLLGHWWRFPRPRAPSWQHATRGQLRRFWRAMEDRARL